VKLQKKLILLIAALFILIETAAVFYAIYSVESERESAFRQIRVVRLGLLPDVSKKYSRKYWKNFLKNFKGQKDFVVELYLANTYDELLTGFTAGSLDLIFVNPATYLDLKKKHDLTPLAFQTLTDEEKEKNRAALVTNKDILYLSQTKGLRITFVDQFSLTGYIVPYYFLRKKLEVADLKEWFSDIYFAPTKSQAFIDLIRGETDVVATDRIRLGKIIDYLQFPDDEIREIWISSNVPEPLLCCFTKFAENNKGIIEQINGAVGDKAPLSAKVDPTSISFIAAEHNYLYKESLTELETYIKKLKYGKKRSNVIMHIGGKQ